MLSDIQWREGGGLQNFLQNSHIHKKVGDEPKPNLHLPTSWPLWLQSKKIGEKATTDSAR